MDDTGAVYDAAARSRVAFVGLLLTFAQIPVAEPVVSFAE
jgi:hypothetical protein